MPSYSWTSASTTTVIVPYLHHHLHYPVPLPPPPPLPMCHHWHINPCSTASISTTTSVTLSWYLMMDIWGLGISLLSWPGHVLPWSLFAHFQKCIGFIIKFRDIRGLLEQNNFPLIFPKHWWSRYWAKGLDHTNNLNPLYFKYITVF